MFGLVCCPFKAMIMVLSMHCLLLIQLYVGYVYVFFVVLLLVSFFDVVCFVNE